MNNSIISTWSPLEVVLPDVEGLDYAAFFVTDAGSIDGLSIDFEKGDWLVYIKKDGIGNWYKTNGLVTFNTSSSANNPDPGFYTKVQLDNNGNIIAGDYLAEDDLPSHAHVFNDITDKDNIKKYIQDTVGEMFNGRDTSTISFEYDDKTGTITGEVNYDGSTIGQDAYGALATIGGGSGGSSGSISIKDVEDLTSKIKELEDKISRNTIITNLGSGLESNVSTGGTELNISVDGSSIQINSYGQLEVNPDFVVNNNGEIESNQPCGNAHIDVDKVDGLEDKVEEILKQNGCVPDVNDIPIDGTSIIVNKQGQLSAVSTAIAHHTHSIKDITDLDFNKLKWASDQSIQGDNNIDFSKGRVNLADQTVGGSISILNKELEKINNNLKEVETRAGKLEPPTPPYIDYTTIYIEKYKEKETLINILSGESEEAGTDVIIRTDAIYPWNRGSIEFRIFGEGYDKEGTIIGSIDLSNEIEKGKKSTDGTITVIDKMNFYKGTAIFANSEADSIKLEYNWSTTCEREKIKPGKYTIRALQKLPENTAFYLSKNTIEVNIYNTTDAVIIPTIKDEDTVFPNANVSGIKVYQGERVIRGKVLVKNAYSGIFSKPNALSWHDIPSNMDMTLSPTSYYEGSASYDIVIPIDNPKYSDANILLKYKNLSNEKDSTAVIKVPKFEYDSTNLNIEKYRCVNADENSGYEGRPSITGKQIFYDPSKRLPADALVIRNNIATTTNDKNYYPLGPNYNDNIDVDGKRWITFMFPSEYRNNIYMDIVKEDGTSFDVQKNGTLKDVEIYVGQGMYEKASNESVPELWIDGNKPYVGYGAASVTDPIASYPGLDLFRSSNFRRWVTFGQNPYMEGGMVFVRIGIGGYSGNTDNPHANSLNCEILVNSILESLNLEPIK